VSKKNNFNKFIDALSLHKYKTCEHEIYKFLVKCEYPDLIVKAMAMDYYFISPDCSLRDVAKTYGVSAERVRQLIYKFISLTMKPSRYDYLISHLDIEYKRLIDERDNLQSRLNAVIMELRQYRAITDKDEKIDSNSSIDKLEFSVRTQKVLESAGIETIQQLIELQELELLQMRNCGRKSVSEIKDVLKTIGLELLPQGGEG